MRDSTVGHGEVRAELNLGWRRRTRVRVTDWVICVALAIASLGLAVWQVPQHSTVSPIDEYVYIDYLAKVPTQFVVHRGEETGSFARHYLTCKGVRTIGIYPKVMCTHPQPSQDSRLPNAGKTTGDLYTPLYFAATWLMAQPVELIGIHDIVEAGRYTGCVWLAAAAILLYLSLRRLKIPWPPSAGAGLLLVGSNIAYWSNTYISTDASALFAGALMFYGVTILLSPGRWKITIVASFAAVVTLLKLQNLMAVAAAALVLLILAAWAATGSSMTGSGGAKVRYFLRDRRARGAAAMIAAGVVAEGVWVVIRALIAVGPLPDQGVSEPLSKSALVREVFKFLPGVSNGAIDPHSVGPGAVVVATIGMVVILVGVLGLLASSERRSLAEAIAGSALVVALLAGPLLAVANVAVSGFYFNLPNRYGASLFPIFVGCAAMLIAKKSWLSLALPAAGIASYIAVFTIQG